jgi:hypothetical protein
MRIIIEISQFEMQEKYPLLWPRWQVFDAEERGGVIYYKVRKEVFNNA